MTVLSWAVPSVVALTKEERLFIWIGVFAGVILVGAAILSRIDRWKKRQLDEVDDTPEQVGSFRDMYERGEISKEEYDRVLRRMAERTGLKPKPVPTPASPVEPASPANEESPPAPPTPGGGL
jgi:hypothetical protein